jgi:hypothetical protein
MVTRLRVVNRDRRIQRRRRVALCAVTAVRRHAAGMESSIAEAAATTGSNSVYVRAAITILKSEDQSLLDQVLLGQIPLLMAAKQVRRVADIVAAYRNASEKDPINAARLGLCATTGRGRGITSRRCSP